MWLLLCGCSHTKGAETRPFKCNDHINYAYGAHLAKKLNANYINVAKNGASNPDILLQATSWINKNPDKLSSLLVVVGWSESARMNLPGYYIAPDPLKAHLLQDEEPESYKQFYNHEKWTGYPFDVYNIYDKNKDFAKIYLQYFLSSEELYLRDLGIKIMLQQFLLSKNINFLSFPTASDIYLKRNTELEKILISRFNILNNETVNVRGKKQPFSFIKNFKDLGFGDAHLLQDAHKEVANFLFKEIILRKLLPLDKPKYT